MLKIKKFFYKNILIIVYLFGLLIPFLYLIFIKNIKYIFNKKFILNKNGIGLFFIFFLLLQLFSTLLSLYFSEYNNNVLRYIAIMHNYINYMFILIGISIFIANENYKKRFFDMLPNVFYFIIFFAIFSFLYSFKMHKVIGYNGVLSFLTGISNSYTQININSIGYLNDGIFPRTRIFGIYSNSSAIIIFIISVFFLSFYIKKFYLKILLLPVVVFALFTTGSRITIIAFLLWSFLFLHKNRSMLIISLVFLIIILIIYYQDLISVVKLINSLRSDSNSTRFSLYLTSLKIMYENNFLLGLGLKPKDLTINILPIGSHSSVIGYFVKNGIVGGMLFLCFYIYIFLRFIKSLFLTSCYTTHTYLVAGIFSLFLIYVFEDLDAYEFSAFLTGTLFYFAFYEKRFNYV